MFEEDDLYEEYEDCVMKGYCPACGTGIRQKARGRPRQFCSQACRLAWHHKHPQKQNWKDTKRNVTCPICGKEFTVEREYGVLRKTCSRACANRLRAKKEEV